MRGAAAAGPAAGMLASGANEIRHAPEVAGFLGVCGDRGPPHTISPAAVRTYTIRCQGLSPDGPLEPSPRALARRLSSLPCGRRNPCAVLRLPVPIICRRDELGTCQNRRQE